MEENPIGGNLDEEIRKKAWSEIAAAVKRSREQRAEQDRLAALGEGSIPEDQTPMNGVQNITDSHLESGKTVDIYKRSSMTGLPITAKPNKKKVFKCVIYPDNQFKGLWDILITA